ncbi:serine hydrolase [Mongoliitalea lutea]|uniref:Serine hydrolase n=2 Tax=Mongoliitalea lutea TaxID=849756 RepID=A0A8J3CVM1_9BACT|nr:serine hydrolase [Mongoliitalea lutea]
MSPYQEAFTPKLAFQVSSIMSYILVIVLAYYSFGCVQEDDRIPPTADSALYFPPINSEEWESISMDKLGWNTSELSKLLTFLEEKNTRAFIVLKDGKIVIEEYFGENILGTSSFGRNTRWYWASAGKTLTATLVGIAQQEGLLSISKPTSDYLGKGWTSLPLGKEAMITVKNQLTMTTGLEYIIPDLNCTTPSCLRYRTDAGQQWFYHNAPYTLLKEVIERATGMDYNEYTNRKISSLIGMNGQWVSQGNTNVFWSTGRDMARFGLLMLNKGKWHTTEVLRDEEYYKEMVTSSQRLNPSYGYLWWLNGKASIIFPGLPLSYNLPLSKNAPSDLFAGIGKNGQFVEIIPSKNLVVIRMGEAPDDSLVPITFHDDMWEKIKLLINE